ncbi:hypothetical protein [Tenacibaculum finnmarkense]|uniref:hypothetical protein n=1 Tax=Tenacibaculum finnmarkense TaxID=2781243 RepID=UPI001EFAFB2C|nr:hypothetical protein [Tenacibaculum finnmarkense]MCG8802270.1 hypothetical protein [Tenacibaculum finnmarkense]MCG8824998.1 hypothetical protein [Tenacibaculum finnmarkense]
MYGKLKKLKLFKGTIKKFENNKNYNLILEEGINCNNVVADACTDGSDLANGNIRISFQSLGNNNLSLAVSMLHEGIHAEIYKYVDEYKKGLDPNDRPNLLYYYNQFKAKNALDKGTTFAQHEHMQDKYIIPIAKAIRKLDGSRYPLNEYIGFSWDGLLVYRSMAYGGMFQVDSSGKIAIETDTFKKLVPKLNDRQKIANIVVNEQKNNDYAKGTKCD